MKKIFKTIYVIIKTTLIAFMFLLGVLICMQRFSDNQISFLGYRMFAVMTGSMAPKYNIKDILLCHEVDPSKLNVGDDITYKGEVGSFAGKMVTHRIIKVIENDDGTRSFQTRGIAAASTDPIVKESQIYGKIITKLELISKLYGFVSQPMGFYLCIFIPLAILIGNEIVVSMVERFEDKREKLRQKTE